MPVHYLRNGKVILLVIIFIVLFSHPKRYMYQAIKSCELKWHYSFEGKPDVDRSEVQIDGRYNHTYQVQERLNFLR